MSTIPADGRHCTLLMVHGRGSSPPMDKLQSAWTQALSHGVQRDHGQSLERVNVEMVYYADLIDQDIPNVQEYDEVLDLADREQALSTLSKLKSAKGFRRSKYEELPGQSALREFLADIGVPVFRILGLSEKRLKKYLPELIGYWADAKRAESLRQRLLTPLNEALQRGDHVLVIAHCMGSVLCYDTFIEASQAASENRVHTWITLGSPLADDDVKRRLLGQPGQYPKMLLNWFNIAAEDDPYCHDETVVNDFRAMLSSRQISRIQDYHIYNLTERFGSSDPHSELGYLIHPRTSQLVVDWLNAIPGT